MSPHFPRRSGRHFPPGKLQQVPRSNAQRTAYNLGARWQERQMAAKFVAVCQYFHPFTHISPLSGRRFLRFRLHWIHVTNAHHPAPAMWRELHGATNASWHYVMPALTVLAAYRAYFLRSICFKRSFDSFQGSASFKCGLDGKHAALPAANQAQQRPRPESIGKNTLFCRQNQR